MNGHLCLTKNQNHLIVIEEQTFQMSTRKRSSATSYAKPVKTGKIGLLDYEVYNVRGDGSCFYRATYQILRESPKGLNELNLMEGGITEDIGVKHIRDYVGNVIKNTQDMEAIESIDNLCGIVDEVEGEEDRAELYEGLNEMYPFITEEVCDIRGVQRYRKVASMIEDMEELMYASSLEIDIIKRTLESIANLSVVVISSTGKRNEKVETKWKNDLLGLLQNTTKRDIGILLNKNNVHYQYLVFKGPSDENYHTIMDRRRMIQLLDENMDVLSRSLQSMSISGGGKLKELLKKKKKTHLMFSVAPAPMRVRVHAKAKKESK